MQALQLQFQFMDEVGPRPIPCDDDFPFDEGQAPDQPSKPLCASKSAVPQPFTRPSALR